MSLEAALDELPLFPLPGAVLLPDAHLELHVFEPRYRALLEHCMDTHRHMAVVQIQGKPRSGDELPPIASIAGVGSIEHREQLPDGRSHIVLVGRARVQLEELEFAPPFRRARARVVADVEGAPVQSADETALLAALQSFIEALRRQGPNVTFERSGAVSASEVAHHVTQHLIFDPAIRQEVLEMRDPAERVARVTAALLAQRTQLLAGDGSPPN